MLRLSVLLLILTGCSDSNEVVADAGASSVDSRNSLDSSLSHDAGLVAQCGDSVDTFPCKVNEEFCYVNQSNSAVECQEPVDGNNSCETTFTCDCVLHDLAQRCTDLGQGALIIEEIGA